ncbi:hypothetical protein [Herbaspirillum sp. VT-16-41]|uniref:hypothetical protein n=1 Tax=Herbaspirillum sp. VT-16-41 TaxID=1953765 RepID=UPI0009809DEC|nr:hypothetical protein [Herbaspirillum sp. VT-16-41]ONN68138.1 hypothetical protein BTM36_01920 [Herbaspirillum sp. VT-16-41]
MVAARDLDRYIGRPYDAQTFDCADLAVLVQRELFGRQITLPADRLRRHAQVASLARYRDALAVVIGPEEISDGDAVLMKGDSLHIGTLFYLAGSWRVLHNSHALGGVWLHKLADLRLFGLFIEGFYRWK